MLTALAAIPATGAVSSTVASAALALIHSHPNPHMFVRQAGHRPDLPGRIQHRALTAAPSLVEHRAVHAPERVLAPAAPSAPHRFDRRQAR